MEDVMTMEEIKARFAPDWVLIGDYVSDKSLEIVSGRVLFHSPDRDAVYEEAMARKLDRSAVEFLGEVPADMVFVF